MKCQCLFSGKNKINISKCCLLIFLPSMLRVDTACKVWYMYLQSVMPDVMLNIRHLGYCLIIQHSLDPIYTGLVTTVQVLYLLEICCRG